MSHIRSVFWIILMMAVGSNIAGAVTHLQESPEDLATNNIPNRNQNQIIVRPGVVLPTNYTAPLPVAKQPFIPVIENKIDSLPHVKKVKSRKKSAVKSKIRTQEKTDE